MKYANIPDTDLRVSGICLGTMNYGGLFTEEFSFDQMDRFIDLGGNFIDTAHIYNDWIPGERCRSEKLIGRWMRARKNRGEIVLGTKGAHPELNVAFKPRLSKAEISKDLEESLEYLQTDYIDIYWLHRDDPGYPVEDIIDTLDGKIREGKIRYIGCSNWKASRIKEAADYAEKAGKAHFIANQMMWSLAKVNVGNLDDKTLVTMDEEEMKYHRETGLTAIPYSSQAKGFFSKLHGAGKMSDKIDKRYANELNMSVLEKLERLSKELGLSVNALSLAYICSQKDFLSIPIVGLSSDEQLLDSFKALDVELDANTLQWLINK